MKALTITIRSLKSKFKKNNNTFCAVENIVYNGMDGL